MRKNCYNYVTALEILSVLSELLFEINSEFNLNYLHWPKEGDTPCHFQVDMEVFHFEFLDDKQVEAEIEKIL